MSNAVAKKLEKARQIQTTDTRARAIWQERPELTFWEAWLIAYEEPREAAKASDVDTAPASFELDSTGAVRM